MKGNTEEEKAKRIVIYLKGKAFDFYFNHITLNEKPATDPQRYETGKIVILESS